MAKKSGLGKGLDSLIPDFYNEDFDSNSAISLEDMLGEDDPTEEGEEDEKKRTSEKSNEEISKVLDDEENNEESTQEVAEEKLNLTDKEKENIEEVKKIVRKNPRITLWSSRSSCVFRYLRKTEPEFSISKEASTLIDKAVSEKYPEIWELFEDI